jgi:hypothetical protein
MQLRDWLLEHSDGSKRQCGTDAVRDPLTVLRAEFDRELAVLQLPGASEKLRNVFASAQAEIAEAANASRNPSLQQP